MLHSECASSYLFHYTHRSVAECRFFDSKMRPLLLVFKNPDTSAEHKDIRIIFKNGDGMLLLLSQVCTITCFYCRSTTGHAHTSDHQYHGQHMAARGTGSTGCVCVCVCVFVDVCVWVGEVCMCGVYVWVYVYDVYTCVCVRACVYAVAVKLKVTFRFSMTCAVINTKIKR